MSPTSGTPKLRRPRRALVLGGWLVSLLSTEATPAGAEPGHRAHAESAETIRHVSFQAALREAASAGPAVRWAEAPRGSRAEAQDSARLPTQLPTFQAQLGPRVSSAVVDSPEIILTLSQALPVKNVGRTQEELAQAEADLFEAELRHKRLEAAIEAGSAWIELALSEELLVLREQAVGEAEAVLALARVRVGAGELDPGEVALAESEVATARAAVLDAEGLHFEAASRLAFATGTATSTRLEVEGKLDELVGPAAPGREGNTQARILEPDAHPALQSARQRSVAADKAADFAAASGAPAVSLGVQYQKEATGDQILTGIVSMPIPMWRPWKFAEHRQRASADQDRAWVDVVRRQFQQTQELAEHEHAHARARYRLLGAAALPASEEALRIARVQFEKGETDLVRLSLSRRAHLTTQEKMTEALADLARAELTLRGLSGSLLEPALQESAQAPASPTPTPTRGETHQ